MRKWIEAAKTELDIDLDVDVAEVLDVTKVVAHNVTRPAAPPTAFLIGYAAGLAGGGPEAVTAACEKVTALAEEHASDGPT